MVARNNGSLGKTNDIHPLTNIIVSPPPGYVIRQDQTQVGFQRYNFCLMTMLSSQGFPVSTVSGICSEVEKLVFGSTNPDKIINMEGIESPYGDEIKTGQAITRTLLLEASGKLFENSILLKLPYFGDEAKADDPPGFPAKTYRLFVEITNQGWDSRFFAGGIPAFYMFHHYISQFLVGNRPFKDYFPTKAVPCPSNASPLEFAIVHANLIGRRLITTTSGHVGLAPVTAVSGDTIYVIVGCSMPAILRPDSTGKYYEVVGECFVDGFMKGEAMKDLDDGKHKLQEIILC